MYNFKQMLKTHKLTQQQVANKIGVHQTRISQWCCNKGKPSIFQAIKLSQIIGVPLQDVINCFFNKD